MEGVAEKLLRLLLKKDIEIRKYNNEVVHLGKIILGLQNLFYVRKFNSVAHVCTGAKSKTELDKCSSFQDSHNINKENNFSNEHELSSNDTEAIGKEIGNDIISSNKPPIVNDGAKKYQESNNLIEKTCKKPSSIKTIKDRDASFGSNAQSTQNTNI